MEVKPLTFSFIGGISTFFITFFTIFHPSVQTQKFSFEEKNHIDSQIDELLQDNPILTGGIAGISIRSAENGQIIYEHNGNVRLRPASNMKLLTAAAALSVLGENHTFSTEVSTDGRLKGNTLYGNLFLKGKGDPTLLKEDLDGMAEKIAQMGIRRIEGNLVGDDSWYDGVRLSPDLIWSDEYIYYGAQVSALTVSPNHDFDTGSILIEVLPSQTIGKKAVLRLSQETDYVKIDNETVTVSPDGVTDITFDREHGSNTIIVKGMIPVGSKKEKELIAVWEPTKYVLSLFRHSLAIHGITLSGSVKIGKAQNEINTLTNHKSIPLSELLIPFIKLSNNNHAETLIKEMGKLRKGEGSWKKGLEVLNDELPQLGVNPENSNIRDGSGISHITLIPANEISNLLYHVQKEPWFHTFLNSLPIAGEPERLAGGSLRNRMGSLNVKAKTGTLTTVTSLSGYVETKRGELLIFSILLNNLLDEEKGKEIEDKIVGILANQ